MRDRTDRLRHATDAAAHRTDPVRENGKALGLTENCIHVLMSRYLKKDSDGHCTETPHELFTRVAKVGAAAEADYGATKADVERIEQACYDMMVKGVFMPNSPTLMNAGREMGMLSACFVLPVGDSIDEIFDTVKATALIQKAGGGTGFAFDRLRPTGDWIKSSGGTTSGPISFWKVLSEATNAIQQGAFRRGANMGMMKINHP
ncbi:MAG: ribonucleotide reductase N-terminal alpha domain-containing protein, partial [Planctomycetota bacterium]